MIIGCVLCFGIGEFCLALLFLLGMLGCPIATKWYNFIKSRHLTAQTKCKCNCCNHESQGEPHDQCR